jgi:uncharacterized protein (DUF2236 family)
VHNRSGSIAQRVNAERVVLFGWSRAILLQLAHPLIAAGVAEHSSFRGGPLAAASRLHHTVRSMLALTFGDPARHEEALDVIRTIHRRVNGRLPVSVGRFPEGTPFSAEDPDLLLWVHATLLDSLPLIYERLVGTIDDAERDAYCAQSAGVAVALGARGADVPRTWAKLRGYLDTMYASDAIVVGPQARQVASAVLAPPLAAFVAPVAWANRVVTVGLLPPHIREQYGFAATGNLQLERTLSVIRTARRLTPDRLALWPEARTRGK